jgi:cation diffusion facilitator CzcD-associated flavoprotein CzcO
MSPEVVIVGAGPAGLAVGACLARRGVRARLLERGAAPGWSWVQHYESLRLHTSRPLSALPGLGLRSTTPYPDRAELIAYLAEYARKLDLDIEYGCEVLSMERAGDLWEIETSHGRCQARHVVLATGFFAGPRTPDWPGRDLFQGRWLQPEALGSEKDWTGRRVLLVGLGNTAADMIPDLWRRSARVTVSVRGPVHVVPLEVLGVNSFRWSQWLPDRAPTVGRFLGARAGALAENLAAQLWFRIQERRFGDLREHGLALKTPEQILLDHRAGRPPVIGGPWVDLVRRGEVPVAPTIAEVTAEGVVFADGRRERFDDILLATGKEEGRFRLAGDLPERLRDGPVPGRPGLWLCGAAPALRHIRRSAMRIAGEIARELAG